MYSCCGLRLSERTRSEGPDPPALVRLLGGSPCEAVCASAGFTRRDRAGALLHVEPSTWPKVDDRVELHDGVRSSSSFDQHPPRRSLPPCLPPPSSPAARRARSSASSVSRRRLASFKEELARPTSTSLRRRPSWMRRRARARSTAARCAAQSLPRGSRRSMSAVARGGGRVDEEGPRADLSGLAWGRQGRRDAL